MTRDKGFSAGAVALLCLSAATIGAGVALLFAPQSGRKSQQQLRRYGKRAQNSLHEFVDQASESISQAIDKGQEFLQENTSVSAKTIGVADDLQKERKRRSGTGKVTN